MLRTIYSLLTALLLSIIVPHDSIAQSLFVSGDWLKIGVTETGVYKVNAEVLNQLNLKNKVSSNFRLYGFTERQLAQENTAALGEYREVAIEVNDVDEQFSGSDFFLFYAEGPNRIEATNSLTFSHKTHAYSDTAYYFLNVSGNMAGKRIQKSAILNASNATQITYFDDAYVYEKEAVNLEKSGRQWFGDFFNSQVSFGLPIEGIIPESEIQLHSAVLATLQAVQNLDVKLNGKTIGSHALQSSFYDATHPSYRYFRRGYIDTKTFKTTASGGTTALSYQFPTSIPSPSGAYLDYFLLHSKRNLQFYEKQVQAVSFESLKNETTEFLINNYDTSKRVWEVTNPFENQDIALRINGAKASFLSATKNYLKKYALFSDKNLLVPSNFQRIFNVEINITDIPNLLIISPKEFISEANRLAKFRKDNDNLLVSVVTTEQLYNHFSGGMLDPTALRNYIRELWKKNPAKLKYVLLFGDATFDYKNKLNLAEGKTDLTVPTYESRESLEPVYSNSSDDYFGFLEPNEGVWREGEPSFGSWDDSNAGSHTLDVGIGRLPVKNVTQAKQVVDKLIYYDKSPHRFGTWRNRLSFVADDEDVGFDYNIHLKDADKLSDIAIEKNNALTLNKIYVGAMPQTSTPNGQRSPDARKALNEAVEKGSLIINYNGHGSEDGWTDEKILTIDQLIYWRNLNNMPLLLTATCEFGRYDNPGIVSGAELAMLNPKGGAIGLLTTTRPVYSTTNFLLNNAFYNALENNEKGLRLGDIFKQTKNASISGMANRNFTLLGDPSMKLALPDNKVEITAINGKSPANQQLSALQKVKIAGKVGEGTFNGSVQITLFDKETTQQTLTQNNNRIATFKNFKNILYNGVSIVKNGVFETEFIVPKDIDYRVGKGKFYFYAVNTDSTVDYMGSFSEVLIGGSAENFISDTTPPKVVLTINKDNVLTANISDESGINLSQTSIGHEILLTLNDTLTIIGNSYYRATNDYSKGVLTYPFGKLPAGNYTIQLKIWDTYNNVSTESLPFTVYEEKIVVTNVNVYPNPSAGLVNFDLKHTALNQDVTFTAQIFNNLGQLVYERSETCYFCDTEYQIQVDFSTKVFLNGAYIYRILAQDEVSKKQSFVSGKVIFWK